MTSDPLRPMAQRLRQQRLALIAEVCRYTGIETRQHLRKLTRTPSVSVKAQLEPKCAPTEILKKQFDVNG